MDPYSGNRIYMRRPGAKPLSLAVVSQHGEYLVAHSDTAYCSVILDMSTEATRRIRQFGQSCAVRTFAQADSTGAYRSPSDATAAAKALNDRG